VWYVFEVLTFWWVFGCSLFLTGVDHVTILFAVRFLNDTLSATFSVVLLKQIFPPYLVKYTAFYATRGFSATYTRGVHCSLLSQMISACILLSYFTKTHFSMSSHVRVILDLMGFVVNMIAEFIMFNIRALQQYLTLCNKTNKYTCKNTKSTNSYINNGIAIPLQAWTGPEGSRRLRLPDFKIFGT